MLKSKEQAKVIQDIRDGIYEHELNQSSILDWLDDDDDWFDCQSRVKGFARIDCHCGCICFNCYKTHSDAECCFYSLSEAA